MARKNRATTGGRKKIAIERIASEEARHVCFSKRRNGVFTKATDLSTLCGAEVAVIVNSPVGNPYSFGSPGVNEVVNRFVSRNPRSNAENVYRMGRIRELNAQCMELSRRLDAANAKKAEMDRRVKEVVERNVYCKLAEESEGVGVRELKAVEEAMGGVRMQAERRLAELMRGRGASSSVAVAVAATGHAAAAASAAPPMAVNPMRMFDGQLGYGWADPRFGYGFYR